VVGGYNTAAMSRPFLIIQLRPEDETADSEFEAILRTQFHPEGDLAGFTVRINAYRHHGYFPPETADDLILAVAGERTPVPNEILGRFVDRFRR
jgi:hypothetical protein